MEELLLSLWTSAGEYLLEGQLPDGYCLMKSTDFYNILSFVDSIEEFTGPDDLAQALTMTQQND